MLRSALLILALAVSQPSPAQEGTIRIVLGFPAGASSDLLTRLLADQMRAALEQAVIVENRTGAGGQIANEAVKNLKTDKGAMMAAALDEGKGYVLNAAAGNISLVDLRSHQVVQTLPGGKGAMACEFTADKKTAWVSAGGEDALLAIDTQAHKEIARVKIEGEPHGLALSKDGKRAYVVLRKKNQLAIFDTGQKKVVKTASLGKRPDMVVLSPDGRTLYVTSRDEDKFLVVDAGTLTVRKAVDTGKEPHGVEVR